MKFCLGLLLFVAVQASAQSKKTSTAAGGNWQDVTTWVGGVLPASNDTVEIVNGSVVTVNKTTGNTMAGRIELSGTIEFSATAHPLEINGPLVINSSGILKAVKANTTFSKAVIIHGSITNNGILYAPYAIEGTTPSTTGGITMAQASAVTGISGTGTFSVFRQLAIDNSYGVNLNVPLSISSKLILLNGIFNNRTNLTMDNTVVGTGPNGNATSSGNLRTERSQAGVLEDPFTFGSSASLFLTYFTNTGGANPSTTITEGYEVPSGRSIHGITIDHAGGIIIKNNLTLRSGSVPLVLNNGIVHVNKGQTLTCNSTSFAGSGGLANSFVQGGLALAVGTTEASRTFPVGLAGIRRYIVLSGVKAATGTAMIRFEITDTTGGTAGTGITIEPSIKRRASVVSGTLHSFTGLSFMLGRDEEKYAIGTIASSSTWNGVYTNIGTSVRTLTSISLNTGTYTSLQSYALALPVTPSAGNFDSLRHKWASFLTGGNYSMADPEVSSRVQAINNSGNSTWRTNFIQDTTARTQLWTDLNYSASDQITTSYSRLKTMALAYRTQGAALFGNDTLRNDIINALDWLYRNQYNETVTVPVSGSGSTGNWWDYRIGSPLRLNDIAVLMYDDLSSTQRQNYTNSVRHCMPNTGEYTGANLVWASTVMAIRSLVADDSVSLFYAKDQLSPVFQYVNTGDGFYEDGSFIQHIKHAYNGAYGLALFTTLTDILYLFSDTPCDITDPAKANVVKWGYDAFEPLMFKGGMMSMVRGREIARRTSSEHGQGRSLVEALLLMKEMAGPADAARISSMVKHWLISDSTFATPYTGLNSLLSVTLVKDLLADNAIPARSSYHTYRQFSGMDRAVHQTPGYAFGISMHSSRIYNYELINGENLKGWHTSDGMTYLNNNDLLQYDNFFWPTVNAYRLPGTTVEDSVTATQNRNSNNAWVGGSSLLGKYGTTGMFLTPYGTTLNAKKSWFLFDGKIVALGASIYNNDNKTVSTYIDQRKISSNNSNTFQINGVSQASGFGTESAPATFTNVNWAHLSGNVTGADIGYYFPGSPTLRGLRKAQSGRWSDVTTGESTVLRTQQYITLWKEHGNHTADNDSSYNTYAYVLLPGFTATQTQAYATNPGINILRNDQNVQAVHDTSNGLLGANFWNSGTHYVPFNGDTAYLSSDKKSSVMLMVNADTIAFGVSDPTMLNTGNITIRLKKSASDILYIDPAVTVNRLTPDIEFTVNASGLNGGTSQLILSAAPAQRGVSTSLPALIQKIETPAEEFSFIVNSSSDPLSLEYTIRSDKMGKGQLAIYTMNGSLAGKYEVSYNAGINKKILPVAHHAKGIYLAVLTTDGKVYTQKYYK
jgi:hyaluronate lyase